MMPQGRTKELVTSFFLNYINTVISAAVLSSMYIYASHRWRNPISVPLICISQFYSECVS